MTTASGRATINVMFRSLLTWSDRPVDLQRVSSSTCSRGEDETSR
ncbi:hypothetical protein [Actinoalloteichus sp. GBA129-24]|nr:hypothetical protein [Actinoalloteichus sp. GBA129-24]